MQREVAQGAPAQKTVAASAEEITQRISDLESNQFDIRQRAQQQLERTALPALEAVASVAQSGSLESSTRAINILLTWAESKDQTLQLAALEKLAKLDNRPRESAMASRRLADVRERVAIEKLVELGAEISRDNSQLYLRIRIGPEWKGGNEGLKHLADVPHAYQVALHLVPLTDPALEHLSKLTQLQKVELHNVEFSEVAVQKLQQQLPALFDIHNGPMLGISGVPDDTVKTSVGIIGVVKNGAANKAGIKRGDRITEINGEPVGKFKELTDRIAKYQPGDNVKMTILRQNKTLEVNVKLGAWGEQENNLVKPNGFRAPRQLIQRLPVQEDRPSKRR